MAKKKQSIIDALFNRYSMTYTGLVVIVVSFLGDSAGVPIAEGDIETTITTIGKVVGAIAVWYGRFRKGDVNLLGARKK